ncbi:MAG: flagellar M-ring protein FliF [Rhodospirillales bacterium RIFCSPLOWO2_12_FULL_58_28]|nr:MAG: flagellar M-ring protein FliF [Rhodospirillales bacterium RIFCSPLOWO2_02_FULL_58_16]OHC77626.1 MAG: flagellar M-ring protein FliF [Rhodospirillales bacterium RIFCSPLOWO2_12_FULL_58_28]
METLVQALRNLGPMRLAVMGAMVFGLVFFFIYLITRFGTPQMSLLYGDLAQGDSSRIISQLDSQNIPYELKGNGAQIFVPGDKVAKLRMDMAGQGLPSAGAIGYEIFDTASTLGTTNFVQNINLVRAMEGELARTIGSLDMVRSARVHLVLPKRELFSRQQQPPSASIIIKMGGAGRLSNEQVLAVQHLVAAAVPGLAPNLISIIDNKGALLAPGFDGGGTAGSLDAKAEERKRGFENRLARTIEGLLEKTVGFGRARAEVTSEMDFDRIDTTEEQFIPDGQVVRSTQSIEESANSNEADSSQQVGVANNLPDPNIAAGGAGGASAKTAQNRTEETINFEISKKIINHVRESGIIKRLSVAVLVDGVRTNDQETGKQIYAARPAADMELLATLVRSAIGFNADRGDSVDVINMEFADLGMAEEKPLELFFGLDKNDMLRIAEFLVLGIVAILVILLVVRPLVSRAFESIPTGIAVTPDGRLLADTSAPALGAPMPKSIAPVEEEHFEELIDIDRVEGRVKASSVKKVGEIIGKHPDEALSIIRSWMYQES